MADALYGTPAQVVEQAPKLRLDQASAPELATTAIQARLNFFNEEMKSAARRQKFTLPLTDTPLTAAWLILELLSVEAVAAEIFFSRTLVIDPRLRGQALTQGKIAAARLEKFKRGILRKAFTGDIYRFDTAALCTRADVSFNTPGFVPDATHPPTNETLDWWILRYSAYVRALAALQGYETRAAKLNDDESKMYRAIIGSLIGPIVLRSRSTYQYGAAVDGTVNDLLTRAEDRLAQFERGEFRKIFKRRTVL